MKHWFFLGGGCACGAPRSTHGDGARFVLESVCEGGVVGVPEGVYVVVFAVRLGARVWSVRISRLKTCA